MTKRNYDAHQTKINIMETAMKLFAAKGYADTSIDDICQQSGSSKGSMYYHFKSKEQLFLALAEDAFTKSWDHWLECSSSLTSATAKLYAYADYFVDHHNRPLNKAGEEFIAKIGPNSEAGQKFFVILMRVIDDMESIVKEGIAAKEFKHEDPKELAFIIMSYFSGLSDSYLFMNREQMKQLFHNATRLLLEGITSDKGD
ncbi:transcriptional regulator [Paenibacillus selenitireducens]|jgi:AcrR family transcriptional regulator|uniref:Transcriptional regulator n=1 Tax=Paenibacillus selenitireducens TaxID=1324314 RepID=A0A1T2X0U5_9BACL|nr:TetR/AcrR family transcriptional regulator [Paenibacillus selenitireducens]OPA73529.1 transcriptional regulator [Paenibacillus selenitireducens]